MLERVHRIEQDGSRTAAMPREREMMRGQSRAPATRAGSPGNAEPARSPRAAVPGLDPRARSPTSRLHSPFHARPQATEPDPAGLDSQGAHQVRCLTLGAVRAAIRHGASQRVTRRRSLPPSIRVCNKAALQQTMRCGRLCAQRRRLRAKAEKWHPDLIGKSLRGY